ncbi:MAG: hypothetical protein BMS9Abin30_0765 [Gammaproteobacteria bacterium]|nr:MAG: hypothetical protein BMS9Abin30_0765 [Gammaproteobacteria bacterium]
MPPEPSNNGNERKHGSSVLLGMTLGADVGVGLGAGIDGNHPDSKTGHGGLISTFE